MSKVAQPRSAGQGQKLQKGTYRMTHEEQLALVPRIFRPYWLRLARANTYHKRTFGLEFVRGLENEPVLEAGCGDDSNLRQCNPPLNKLVGLDPCLSDIRKNPAMERKALGVLETTPFADNAFAAIYCDCVFEHIDDPRRVCQEMFRVTRPGGRVLAITNSVFHPLMFPNKYMTLRQREWVKEKLKIINEGTYEAPYRINTRRRMIKYLSEAGFTNIKVYRWGAPIIYRPRWILIMGFLLEMIAEIPLFSGLKYRLMATAEKPLTNG